MRVLIKLSGEALMGKLEYGVSEEALQSIAKKIIPFSKLGHEVAIVTGGGNIFRGIQGSARLGLDRTPADQMGMLATIMNGILLKQAFKKEGVNSVVMSGLNCPDVAEEFQWEKAQTYLKNGLLLIFVGGTGHPYFTTDTAAALRASEIGADLLLKATGHVNGIYDSDPRLHKGAKKYDQITYQEVIEKKLGVMDLTAITLCMTNKIPIRIVNLHEGNLVDAVGTNPQGSIIYG